MTVYHLEIRADPRIRLLELEGKAIHHAPVASGWEVSTTDASEPHVHALPRIADAPATSGS